MRHFVGMIRIASCAAVLVLGLVTACGDGDGGGNASGTGPVDGDPVPADQAPEEAQQTFCGAWTECDCATFSDRYASQAECESEIAAALEDDLAQAAAAGLTYDPECMGDLLATYDAFGCRTLDELIADADDFARFAQICKVFYGDDQAGTPCEEPPSLSGDSCARGLECEDGTCIVRQLVDKGQPCNSGDLCDDGAVCVPVDSLDAFECAELPEAGQTCLGVGDLCSFDAYCDQGSKTCRALPAIGEACVGAAFPVANRCAEGGVCENETCVAAPKAGEPCSDACEAGTTCDDGVCVVVAPLTCGIDFDDD